MGVWETLNGVYEQLYRRVQSIGKALAEAGYTARWGWYNLHGSVRDGEYRVELFPVPVITVGHWCEVILELDCVCVDAHLTCDQARVFDWKDLSWPFEVYGVEDYTEDLYRPGMDLEGLPARLERYGREAGLAIPLPVDCPEETVVAIADACRKWNTHVG